MVAPKVSQEVIACSSTDVAIIGGGVVGVIAANRMRERCIDYRVVERLSDFGGVWHTHSNNHSTLQVHQDAGCHEEISLECWIPCQASAVAPAKCLLVHILQYTALAAPEAGVLCVYMCCLTIKAPEASYRTHPKFPLGKKGPLEQISGNAVLSKLREMAQHFGIHQHTDFNSEVETVHEEGDPCATTAALPA